MAVDQIWVIAGFLFPVGGAFEGSAGGGQIGFNGLAGFDKVGGKAILFEQMMGKLPIVVDEGMLVLVERLAFAGELIECSIFDCVLNNLVNTAFAILHFSLGGGVSGLLVASGIEQRGQLAFAPNGVGTVPK